jgi:hypothetical protein
MYVMYYASILRCWQLVRILVRTNHPCLRVERHTDDPCLRVRCHNILLSGFETNIILICYVSLLSQGMSFRLGVRQGRSS